MKPQNKFQKAVVEASKTLSPITKQQIEWGYKNCIEHIGQRTSKGIATCTECGHKWQGDGELISTLLGCECPNCKTKLTVKTTKKRVFTGCEYLCIVTTCKEYQVLRYVMIKSVAKVGTTVKYTHSEVMQRWIAPNGKYATLAKLRPMGFYSHRWIWWSNLEVRPEKLLYNITPTAIYPRQKLIPEIQRSGYNKQNRKALEKVTPFDTFRYILAENRAETLLKAGQTSLFEYFAYHSSRNIDDYWASIRICLRNKYSVSDATMWCDYIDLLRFFGKDVHNAGYVCPADVKAEHDRYVGKKRVWQKQQDRIKAREKALKDEAKFKEMKSRFFGIEFSDGFIHVRVLESVEEIVQEADAMRHCLFTNNYHLKSDSLILSAYTVEKKLETIELSLSELKILQSQGLRNQKTEYHNRILELVNKNIFLIQKRLSA